MVPVEEVCITLGIFLVILLTVNIFLISVRVGDGLSGEKCGADFESENGNCQTYDRGPSDQREFIRFTDLPRDTVLEVFSFLTQRDTLSLMRTCRRFHEYGKVRLYRNIQVWSRLPIQTPGAKFGSVVRFGDSTNRLLVRNSIISHYQLLQLVYGYRLPWHLTAKLVIYDYMYSTKFLQQLRETFCSAVVVFESSGNGTRGKHTEEQKYQMAFINFNRNLNINCFSVDEIILSKYTGSVPSSITRLKITTNDDVDSRQWWSKHQHWITRNVTALAVEGDFFKVMQSADQSLGRCRELSVQFSDAVQFLNTSGDLQQGKIIVWKQLESLKLNFASYPKRRTDPDPMVMVDQFLHHLAPQLGCLQHLSIVSVGCTGNIYPFSPDFKGFIASIPPHSSFCNLQLAIGGQRIGAYEDAIGVHVYLQQLVWIGRVEADEARQDIVLKDLAGKMHQYSTSDASFCLMGAIAPAPSSDVVQVLKRFIEQRLLQSNPMLSRVVVNGIHFAVDKQFDNEYKEVVSRYE